MATCVYCHKAKGKRSCPALGGLICARCCGEHRLVRIACPSDCIYLTTHEGYQRERSAQAFGMERSRLLKDLKDRKAAAFLMVVEAVIYRHFGLRPTSLDAEVIAGLEEIRRHLSPIALPETIRTPSGEAIWKELEPVLKEIDRAKAAEAVESYIGFAKSFSGAALQSHQFIRGLTGFLEQYQPELVAQIRKQAAPGRIISV